MITLTKRQLGARLRGARTLRGMDLEWLSDETEIPVAVLKTYERGQRVPPGMRLLAIMIALKIQPEDLTASKAEGEA